MTRKQGADALPETWSFRWSEFPNNVNELESLR